MNEEESELIPDFDLSKKKKKKKVEIVKTIDETEDKKEEIDSERDYDYVELLERAFKQLRADNPNHAKRKRYTIPVPQLAKAGQKTMWTNFCDTIKMIGRQPEHVCSFFIAELATEGSMDAKLNLLLKGRYNTKNIESVLKKYLTEYVTCQTCHQPDTTLLRDPITRLYFVKCESCKSQRSAAQIKSGFRATTHADRVAVKNI